MVSLAAAEEAIELADAYGVADGFPLDESQKFTLRTALGERADGSWAAATVGDFEPRQSGKNDTLAARELAGLILFGEQLIIHTAHEFPTANESFLRLVAVFEAWDDLRKKVARIRYANGEQGIELLSGQRLKYRARTGGSGRGFAKADLLVYDEAQHLQAEHVAASGPARLANPNNQSWYMGSGGLSTSANAWRMRRRALAGDGGRFAYVEHTAERLEMVAGNLVSTRPEPLDRDAWALANPAYGRRITDESLESLYEELGPELFARECLCLWDPDPTSDHGTFGPGVWRATLAAAAPGSPLVFALDCSPDRTWAAIAAADSAVVELVEHRRGVSWVLDRAVELWRKWQCRFVVDGSGPAGSLGVELERHGVPVDFYGARDVARACNAFFDDVIDSRFTVLDPMGATSPAVAGAFKKKSGETWRWDRRIDTDISPLMAVTLARFASGGSTPSVYEGRPMSVLG